MILPQSGFQSGFLGGHSAWLLCAASERTARVGRRGWLQLHPLFFQITLPLSRPVLATVGVLALVGSWNAFLLPLVMINSESLYPWPLGIMQYQGQYGTDWGKVLAYISLTLAPAIGFYLLAQKHIIAGLTSGAVKG